MVTIGNDTSGNAAGMYLLQVYVARSTLNETISVVAHGEKERGEAHTVGGRYIQCISYCLGRGGGGGGGHVVKSKS